MAPSWTRRQCQQQKQWRWIINNSSTVDNQCEHKGGRQEEEEVVDGNDEESTSLPRQQQRRRSSVFCVPCCTRQHNVQVLYIYAKRLCLAPSFPRRRRRSSSFSLFHLLFILFKSNLSLSLKKTCNQCCWNAWKRDTKVLGIKEGRDAIASRISSFHQKSFSVIK